MWNSFPSSTASSSGKSLPVFTPEMLVASSAQLGVDLRPRAVDDGDLLQRAVLAHHDLRRIAAHVDRGEDARRSLGSRWRSTRTRRPRRAGSRRGAGWRVPPRRRSASTSGGARTAQEGQRIDVRTVLGHLEVQVTREPAEVAALTATHVADELARGDVLSGPARVAPRRGGRSVSRSRRHARSRPGCRSRDDRVGSCPTCRR